MHLGDTEPVGTASLLVKPGDRGPERGLIVGWARRWRESEVTMSSEQVTTVFGGGEC